MIPQRLTAMLSLAIFTMALPAGAVEEPGPPVPPATLEQRLDAALKSKEVEPWIKEMLGAARIAHVEKERRAGKRDPMNDPGTHLTNHVFIAGGFKQPGPFPLPTNSPTLIKTILYSGGLGTKPDLSRVIIVRAPEPGSEKILTETVNALILLEKGGKPDVAIKPGDLILVPERKENAPGQFIPRRNTKPPPVL